ncbi:hypothetical protein GGR51DRAFT_47335 [Nemania sp. FL0031]|nr:hypothetical protein GGR51DRAFT_47335 [Nemania sp. FL0031]
MGYDPIGYLGLSCPYGGNFYICQDGESQFLGCCDVDPCGASDCPSSALHPATFNRDRYHDIFQQGCDTSVLPAEWYTCTNGPTFLGCCASSPCTDGVCPDEDLAGAYLADNPASASAFLTTTTSLITSSTASVASTTSTPTLPALTTPPPSTSTPSSGATSANKESSHASIGGIVGGIVGGLLVLGLIAFAFFRHRRRRRALDTTPPEEDPMTALQSPWSPYHDSFRNSSIAPPPTVSPLSSTSTHHRSISASLSSLIGFNRSSIAKRQSTQLYTNYEANVADGALTSPVELEGRSPSSAPVYEVLGSVPDAETKDAVK